MFWEIAKISCPTKDNEILEYEMRSHQFHVHTSTCQQKVKVCYIENILPLIINNIY